MTRRKDPTTAKNFANSLTKLRKNKYPGHGGQKKAYSAFGVDDAIWSRWETGRTFPDDVNQRKLATFFGVTLAELRGDHEAPSSGARSTPTRMMRPPIPKPGAKGRKAHLASDGDIILPVVGHAAAAVEGRGEIEQDIPEDPLVIPARTSCVRVSGTSAEPIARDGQLVMVNPEEDQKPKKNALVVIDAKGEGGHRVLFKRWHGWKGEWLLVGSINPTESAEPIHKRDFVRVRLIRGVWMG